MISDPEQKIGRPRQLYVGATQRDYVRLLTLLTVEEGQVDLESTERLFGLPRLHTVYDDPRWTSYSVQVSGGENETQWTGMITFAEGFYPLVDTRPRYFTGSERPVHLRPGERGDIDLSIDLFAVRVGPESPGCLTLDSFVEQAAATGWKPPDFPVPNAHGPPTMSLERGGLSLFPDSGQAGGCLTGLTLNQEPDPPIPPATDEETARIRQQNAELARPEREALWQALPAADEEDRQARNARAKFMTDEFVEDLQEKRQRAGDEAIAAMSPEELREFARTAIHGGQWYAGRELCDLAIKEANPPAALARLAAERKLDPAAAELLRTHCSIFVEGRRYKHRFPEARQDP
jgi:hypothetical protein